MRNASFWLRWQEKSEKNVCYINKKTHLRISDNKLFFAVWLLVLQRYELLGRAFQAERITQIWYDYFIASIGYYQMILWQVVGE